MALLLLIVGHAIGGPGRGMKVDAGPAWRYFCVALLFFRMPLCTVISGYVYALKPVRGNNWTAFFCLGTTPSKAHSNSLNRVPESST